jgi:hypothetical protein
MLIKTGIGGQEMLETPQERVKLLKAGIDGKTIEKLYITYNNFKIVSSPIFFDVNRMQIHSYKKEEQE